MNFTPERFLHLITAIKPAISHQRDPCPAEAMWFIAQAAREQFPDEDIFNQLLAVPDDGRGCPSGEIYFKAKQELLRRS